MRSMPDFLYWIADAAGNPIGTNDVMTWARWFEDHRNRVVAKEQVGVLSVSTVMLGVDHSFGEGPPLLWETMIFGLDGEEEYCERYPTRQAATEGHARAVAWAKEKISNA